MIFKFTNGASYIEYTVLNDSDFKHMIGCYLKNDLILLNEDYDAFISGSDMIWNLEVTGADKSFMCDFASPDKPRFSYGSSIGAKWKSSDLEDVISLLSQYDAIR